MRTALVVAAALLAGCGGRWFDRAEEHQAVDSAPPPLTLLRAGLGPITASTAFDADAVSALLPGYDVEWARYADGGEDAVVVLVSLADAPVAQLYGDPPGEHVGRIDVLSPAVEGPHGGRVGIAMSESRVPGLRCTDGGGPLIGAAVCGSSRDQRIVYLFRHGQALSGRLPPRADLDTAKLERMIWTAP